MPTIYPWPCLAHISKCANKTAEFETELLFLVGVQYLCSHCLITSTLLIFINNLIEIFTTTLAIKDQLLAEVFLTEDYCNSQCCVQYPINYQVEQGWAVHFPRSNMRQKIHSSKHFTTIELRFPKTIINKMSMVLQNFKYLTLYKVQLLFFLVV